MLGTNSSISVFDSPFINNTAMTEGGGAIYTNGQYANVTLTSSTFHNNSASYCGVLDVDNYNHFSVNLTNSIFTYNTASQHLDKPLEEVWPALGMPLLTLLIAPSNTTLPTSMRGVLHRRESHHCRWKFIH